jgi:hypothetical protein
LKPGFVIGTVKISGIASRALLTSVLFGSGSGSQTKLFDKIEIYDLQLATPSEGTVASLVADFPRLAISGVSCAPAIPGAGPECFAKSLDFGPTASLAVRFPEDDPRLLLNLRAETFHAEDSALGGTPGRSPGAFRAAKAQAQGFRAEMALKGPGTVAAVSLAELSAENLDGLWRAGQTAAKELSVSLFAPGGLDWKARAAFFSAAGLDLRDSLAGPASLPGATDLLNLEIPGSLLPGAVWPSWESLLADRYSADSWRAEGFSAEGPYGGKLSAKALAASGPFSKGKISSTSFEAEGFRAEFQVYAWSHALLEFASRFMGEAVLEGNLKASKDYSPEEGNLRLRLDSLEVNSLGKFSLDVTLSGVKEPLLRSLAAIPLSGLEDPLSAAVSQDVGVGAFELTVSGRPVVDKAVLMTADALDVSPSAARAEMTSKIATTLLFLLGPYAETGSILGISDSLIDFVNAPGTLTLKMEPKSPITSRSVPQEGFEPAELISILNISVASNGNEPARLTP